MKKSGIYLTVLIACAIVALGFTSATVCAMDNAAISEMVEGYNETLEKYAEALLSGNWNAVKKEAKNLLEKSEVVHGMREGNKEWLNESRLLVSHSEELLGLAEEKDAKESFFMAAGLFLHFQLLKATNPRWVIAHIEEEIEEISEAIEKKDKKEAIEGAEKVHLGATCAAISGWIMKYEFANTRWIKDAQKMSMAGEEIHETANEGNWDEAEKHLAVVKKIHKKIEGSLKR